ncbi:DNA-binding transcriptional regulator [Phenylobacterium hankyongense]|uniref:DNA-binding transcriptional regulator n=1 Tax=Phenylobacterium hankyongense TaxID=1813876 RepID=A0A328B3I3_9CAUL|nr:YafY family protein [Phenylobacterium hankyongense]RAK61397.1 DNA-binding transcriptional regulator [Phenylobacterium hankyongense]
MRHEKAGRLLDLARLLASTAEGLTLDEMAERLGVGRRTAERMRDAVREVFPQLEEVDDPPTRRFRIPSGLDGLFQAPTADELAALRGAAEMFSAQGAQTRAGALLSLEQKVLSATRAAARRRLAPDLEALLQAETIAVQAGPRPFEDETVLSAVREAVKSLSALRFRYEGGSTPGRVREVTPFGVLFGRSNYLVAAEDVQAGPRNWRLDRIHDVEVVDRPAARPEAFSLQDYADESFGIYHDEVQDVVLRITQAGADEAVRWRFHANQSVEPQADGSVLVRFRASGMLELAWHLFTWGDKVQVLAPPILRETLLEQIVLAGRAHTSGSDAGGA